VNLDFDAGVTEFRAEVDGWLSAHVPALTSHSDAAHGGTRTGGTRIGGTRIGGTGVGGTGHGDASDYRPQACG
jgi:hypothetical protein